MGGYGDLLVVSNLRHFCEGSNHNRLIKLQQEEVIYDGGIQQSVQSLRKPTDVFGRHRADQEGLVHRPLEAFLI